MGNGGRAGIAGRLVAQVNSRAEAEGTLRGHSIGTAPYSPCCSTGPLLPGGVLAQSARCRQIA